MPSTITTPAIDGSREMLDGSWSLNTDGLAGIPAMSVERGDMLRVHLAVSRSDGRIVARLSLSEGLAGWQVDPARCGAWTREDNGAWRRCESPMRQVGAAIDSLTAIGRSLDWASQSPLTAALATMLLQTEATCRTSAGQTLTVDERWRLRLDGEWKATSVIADELISQGGDTAAEAWLKRITFIGYLAGELISVSLAYSIEGILADLSMQRA